MTDLFIQMRTLNKRLKCNMVLKRNRSIPLKLALRCSCIHGKQSKVAHGQPAGNYSTSHHIPEHTWRPRTPRYEFSVQANEVVAISPSFFLSFFPPFFHLQPSFSASVCSSGEDSAHITTVGIIIFSGSRRWMRALLLQTRRAGSIFYSKRIHIFRMFLCVFESEEEEMRRKLYFDSRLSRW